jgi:predicted ATPase
MRWSRISSSQGSLGLANRGFCTNAGKALARQAFMMPGSCSLEDQQTPFLPFIEIVRRSFGVAPGEDQTEVACKLDSGLKALGIATARNLGLLLNLLGLKPPEDSLQGLDGALIGFRTRDLLQQLLKVRCQLSPVIMAIEDLHWVDSASEDLLNQMAQFPSDFR